MKNTTQIYFFDKKCPNTDQYNMYLGGKGSSTFIQEFEDHLNSCELCQAAISGYKTVVVEDVKQPAHQKFSKHKTRSLSKKMSYAAAIAVFATTIVVLSLINNRKQKLLAIAEANIPVNPNKKLMHKSNTAYYYLGNNNRLELNDQIVDINSIKNHSYTFANTSEVIIQIEQEPNAETHELVNNIKNLQSVPVYTFSKQKGLKKN